MAPPLQLARAAVASQAALIVLGWAASQDPYLVVPDLTLQDAAANPHTQQLLPGALALGSVLLFPSLYVLFKVFKETREPGVTDPRKGR